MQLAGYCLGEAKTPQLGSEPYGGSSRIIEVVTFICSHGDSLSLLEMEGRIRAQRCPGAKIRSLAFFREFRFLASPTRVIRAGDAVRAVCEAAGIRDILTKSFGSNNSVLLVKATVEALKQLRTQQEVEVLRGVSLS